MSRCRLPAALLRQCVETVQWHINRLLKTHSSVFEIEPPVIVLGFFRTLRCQCPVAMVPVKVSLCACADEANEAVFAATGHRPLSYDAFYNHKVSAEINLRDDFERWASLKCVVWVHRCPTSQRNVCSVCVNVRAEWTKRAGHCFPSVRTRTFWTPPRKHRSSSLRPVAKWP
jgi:hypothetical protein